MTDDTVSQGAIRRLVDTAWSADSASADPDDPGVRAFAEFGLPPVSPLATEDQLHELETWRDGLQIPANSAFLDGTLLLTVEALLDWDEPDMLTPVTLWELTAFIDALVCFDRLYCVANPAINVSLFNERLGTEVLTVIPDPDDGMLRRVARDAAANGVSDMSQLRSRSGHDDAWGQEVQAVVEGWRAVLGPDLPNDGPFDISGVDIRLATTTAAATPIPPAGSGGLYGDESPPPWRHARRTVREGLTLDPEALRRALLRGMPESIPEVLEVSTLSLSDLEDPELVLSLRRVIRNLLCDRLNVDLLKPHGNHKVTELISCDENMFGAFDVGRRRSNSSVERCRKGVLQ